MLSPNSHIEGEIIGLEIDYPHMSTFISRCPKHEIVRLRKILCTVYIASVS